MDNAELDGMVMSTLETFDMPVLKDYDSDNVEAYEESVEEGYESPNNFPSHSDEPPQSLWNYQGFNDVSDLLNNDTTNEQEFMKPRFEASLMVKGTTFSDKEKVIYECQKYHVKNRVEFMTYKSDKSRLCIGCKKGNEICSWKLRVSKKRGFSTWEITKVKGEHTCHRNFILKDNFHLSKDFVAKDMQTIIEDKLRFNPAQIQAKMKKDFGYKIPYMKAWLARKAALKNLFGEWNESFGELPNYMQALQASNPGTVVEWNKTQVAPNKVSVDRVFWSFAPQIQAFRHCRPVISVDGTHLYGKYNRTLMVAVAIDADNQLLPLAYALVESENNSSWRWFMSRLRYRVTQREGLCIISDRHIGIINAMREEEWREPRAYHRFCLRHFASNFKSKVKKNAMRNTLKNAGYQNQKHYSATCLEGRHYWISYDESHMMRQGKHDFIWKPYDESLFPRISATCLEGRHYWISEVPLICYNIIEWHYPSRVLRQFGYKQNIPPCIRACDEKSHDLQRRKKKNWAVELREYIDMWTDRAERIIVGSPDDGDDDQYLQWFYSVTHRFIQPRADNIQPFRPNAFEHSRYVRALVRDANLAAEIFLHDKPHSNQERAYNIFHSCRNDLVEMGEANALNIDPILIQFPREEDAQASDYSLEVHPENLSPGTDFLNIQSQVTQEPSAIPQGNEKRTRRRTKRYGFS